MYKKENGGGAGGGRKKKKKEFSVKRNRISVGSPFYQTKMS